MSGPAVLAPAARLAVLDALERMATDHPAAARRFRQAISDAARLIGTRPELGRRQPAIAGARFRFWSLAGFPYVLVYDPTPRPPQILRVLHTARDLPRLLADLRG